MKKTIYISGVVIANLLVFGSLFKANHWPGAGVMLTLSIALMSFYFLPIALLNHYKEHKETNSKWLYLTAFFSFFVVFISALFKVQHWPGASVLLLIGVPLPFLLFLPVYIYHSIKNKEQSFINFTAIILGLIFIAVYGVLLSVNVSRDILYSGIELTKSNEKVTDYYQFINDEFQSHSDKDIKNLIESSDRICDLIHQAKKDLLDYSENSHISSDLGKKEFRIENLKNIDSKTMSQFVLLWKDGALLPKIEKEIKAYKNYMNSLGLETETTQLINQVVDLDKKLIAGDELSWMKREFDSDYFVFALESLSRWEKNIRFIENAVLGDLANQETNEL